MLTFYKIATLFFTISSQLIRTRFQQRYRVSHSTKTEVRKAGREKVLYFFVLLAFLVPELLWLFDLLDAGSFELAHLWRILGIGIGFGALLLFFLTHKQLGDNWSGTLELRENHELVTSGVYSLVRHPMYSVFLLNVLSKTLITANWVVGAVGFLAVVIMCIIRIPDEEKMMLDQFGETYQVYMKKTKRLIPYLI